MVFYNPQIFNNVLFIFQMISDCLFNWRVHIESCEEDREDLERVEEVFHDTGTVSFKNRKFWHFLPAGTYLKGLGQMDWDIFESWVVFVSRGFPLK
jgi:hypothetical protein